MALEAVQEAGQIIMHYYADEVRATLKPDLSPVTVADTEAEQAIIKTIEKYFPDHGFIGEESGEKREDAEYRWVIDPIDGTKNFLKKIPLLGTLLALMKGEQLILGVSHVPALNEILHAERGQGAFLNQQPVKCSQVANLKDSSISFGGLNYFDKMGKLDQLNTIIKSTGHQRAFGDLWQYHLLAQGKIDVVVEAQVKFWDIAAPSVIVEEAGGKVTDISGNPITPKTTTIIATNGKLHDSVVEIFNS